jgi:hypothetical protein
MLTKKKTIIERQYKITHTDNRRKIQYDRSARQMRNKYVITTSMYYYKLQLSIGNLEIFKK